MATMRLSPQTVFVAPQSLSRPLVSQTLGPMNMSGKAGQLFRRRAINPLQVWIDAHIISMLISY
jgi:hypothetical protein